MATAQVVRPAQTPRVRRDAPKAPGIVKRLNAASEVVQGLDSAPDRSGEPASKRRKTGVEPYIRDTAYILHKHRGKPVSMTIHLHQNYFRFENQEGSWAFDSPMRFIIEHMRKKTIPHEIIEELLAQHVPFYDGCLIVEIHNHRQGTGKDRTRSDSAAAGDNAKFSMNNYNNYITPSPFAPFPTKTKADDTFARATSINAGSNEKAVAEQESTGPHVSTIVLHPTSLSRHKELELLARTKRSDLVGSNVQAASNSAQAATKIAAAAQDKMVVTPQNMYDFEASLLLHSEPPLYLAPVNNPAEAQRVLELLSDPLHTESPPSPKTRKKTTAQMAADDAQAAELQRRMLIMDERIKPSAGTGVAAGESQGAAASLGISRFKTIQMAKEKIAEQEVAKKAEETQAATKRREQEQAQAEQARAESARLAAEQQRKDLLAQRSEQARRQAAAVQAQQQAQAAAHAKQVQLAALQQAQLNQAQHTNLMNSQQNNLQHANNMARNSPVVRNQTPMVNSSPMLQQGFPVANNNQNAGSPPRPPSAAMPNNMVRQPSHQNIVSHQNTPQMAQNTPNLSAQAMANNRSMSQTPRMTQASPAPGTPGQGGNMSNMGAMSGLNPEQLFMLQQQQQHRQMASRMAMPGSTAPDATTPQMTPTQVQMAMAAAAQRQQLLVRQAQDPSNPTLQARARMFLTQMQQNQQMNAARMQQQSAQNAISNQMASQSMQLPQQSTPGVPQQGHTPEQLNMIRTQQLQEGLKQVKSLMAQYGSVAAIPQSLLSQQARMYIQHQQRQQSLQRQQLAARQQAQMQQSTGQTAMNGGGGNPEYLQMLQQQALSLAAQQNGGHMGNIGMQGMGMGMGMNMGMGANGMQQFGANAQNDFSQQYANMQNAMNQQNRQQGGMQ